MYTYVLVVEDAHVSHLVEMASKLGSSVIAIAVGPRDLAQAVAVGQVERVVWMGEPGSRPPEAFATAVAQVVAAEPGTCFAGRQPAERVLLGAIAAQLRAPIVTDAVSIEIDGTQTVVARTVFGGLVKETVEFDGPIAVMADGGEELEGGGSAPIEEMTVNPMDMAVDEIVPNEDGGCDLSGAKRIVGIGRGLRSAQDLEMIQELAKVLGAQIGCSRPLAEGLQWLPRDQYIGISGQHVAPDLYVMVGISGQLQHMGGCRDAKVIVAIDVNPDAPVANEADYFLPGDLYTLVPALTARL